MEKSVEKRMPFGGVFHLAAGKPTMHFWNQVLANVEKHTNRQCFDTWFRPITYQGCENGVLCLTVPTESFKKCLLENYAGLLLDAAGRVSRSAITLHVSLEAASAPEPGAARSM